MKNRLSMARVMVMGDIILDRYLIGVVERMSPEAPVPVLNVSKKDKRLGGAGNVAANVSTLGSEAILVSILGEDNAGREVEDLLREKGIRTNYIYKCPQRCTTVKTRLFEKEKQLLRYDEEVADDIDCESENRLLSLFHKAIVSESVNCIVMQDYNKGLFTKKVIHEVLKTSSKLKIPIVVDPKKNNFFEYQGVDLLKPNLNEFSSAVGYEIKPLNACTLYKAAIDLKNKNRFKNLLVTLGNKGVFYSNSVGDYGVVPLEKKIKAIDVSGAGDTVASIAAIGMSNNFRMADIASICNRGASSACKKFGVSTISSKDIK